MHKKKPEIVHFIFNLGRGGAETLIVRVTERMEDYEHTIVTLFDVNHFKDELRNIRYISLKLKLYHLLFFPFIAVRFRKMMCTLKPDIVHAHLLWPVVIARMAVPKNIPLITTMHGYISQLIDYRKWYFRWLDRWSFRLRPSTVLAVSRGALEEYLQFLRLPPQHQEVLYTFVDTDAFKPQPAPASPTPFRLVSVGALRYQKNHAFLIEMMKHFRGKPVVLDIYGAGDLKDTLQEQIQTAGVAVHLKGQVHPIQSVLPNYHAMIMSSFYEGFSIGVLEAMAMKIPLVLSDIPSFREQCENRALYFKLDEVATAVQAVEVMMEHLGEAQQRAEAARQRVHEYFTADQHLKQLRAIYERVRKAG